MPGTRNGRGQYKLSRHQDRDADSAVLSKLRDTCGEYEEEQEGIQYFLTLHMKEGVVGMDKKQKQEAEQATPTTHSGDVRSMSAPQQENMCEAASPAGGLSLELARNRTGTET